MTESSFAWMKEGLANRSESAARELFERTYTGIVRLIRARIGQRYQAKIDADSIANSALKSFFVRHAAEPYTLDDWQDVWNLLVSIARAKLSDRLREFQRLKRSVDRENAPADFDVEDLAEAPEAEAIVRDLVDHLMADFGTDERLMIELSLQGYTVAEIAEQIGMSTRTVIRIRKAFQEQLLATDSTAPDESSLSG